MFGLPNFYSETPVRG